MSVSVTECLLGKVQHCDLTCNDLTVKIPDGGYLPAGYKVALDDQLSLEQPQPIASSIQNTRGNATTPGTAHKSKTKSGAGPQTVAKPGHFTPFPVQIHQRKYTQG